jgi:hypothetical protein
MICPWLLCFAGSTRSLRVCGLIASFLLFLPGSCFHLGSVTVCRLRAIAGLDTPTTWFRTLRLMAWRFSMGMRARLRGFGTFGALNLSLDSWRGIVAGELTMPMGDDKKSNDASRQQPPQKFRWCTDQFSAPSRLRWDVLFYMCLG